MAELSMDGIEVPEGPFDTAEDFAAAADDICAQSYAVFDQHPAFGVNNAGIAVEAADDVELISGREDKLAELEAPDDVSDQWDMYLANGEVVVDAFEEIEQSAKDDDTDGVTAAFEDSAKAQQERTNLAKDIGMEVCSTNDPPEPEETVGDSDVSDVDLPETNDTGEEVANAYLDALKSKDCDALEELFHAQTFEFSDETCEGMQGVYADAELVGTATFGPAAIAVFNSEANGTLQARFVRDAGGDLHYVGDAYVGGNTLVPPVEGNHADEVMSDIVEGIRNDDPETFNATLTQDTPKGEKTGFYVKGDSFDTFGTDEKYGPKIVEDIRADEDAEPELLGQTISTAIYVINANGNSYELDLALQPGTTTDYSFNGYYALVD